MIPVLDLATRLELPQTTTRRPCLLVAEVAAAGGLCALAVDGTRGIEELPEDRVTPPRADVLGAGDWLAGFVDTGERLIRLHPARRSAAPGRCERALRRLRLRSPSLRPLPPSLRPPPPLPRLRRR